MPKTPTEIERMKSAAFDEIARWEHHHRVNGATVEWFARQVQITLARFEREAGERKDG